MMHGHEKSSSAIVAVKPVNNTEPPRCRANCSGVNRRGVGGAKGGGRGECEPAKHGPGTEPGNRVTSAGAHTASSKTKEEGEVHCALPPSDHRPALGRV